MAGNRQGLEGLGMIATYSDQNPEGTGGEITQRSVNSNANNNNQVPAKVEMELISSDEEPEIFDWNTTEAKGPGEDKLPQQLEFVIPPPPPPPSLPSPVLEPVPQDDLIRRNDDLTHQLWEEREAKEILTEELDKLKKTLRKENEELVEALRKKDEEILEKAKDLEECQKEKASLNKRLRRAEMDYYDEKKMRKQMRKDLDDVWERLEKLDEEVQRRKDTEQNLATVAFSLDKLQSSVRLAVGPGASLSNDVNELCRQLGKRLNELNASYNVVERNYLEAKEEVLEYQRIYGDRSQQLHDPRIQAYAPPPVNREPLLPTPPSNSLSSKPSSALVLRRPPPPPKELDLEYDPRKTAVIPAKRPSGVISNAGPGPRSSIGGAAAAGFQKPVPPQTQNFANLRERDPRAASGSALGHQPHGHFQGRSTTATLSSSSSSSSSDEPTPRPAPKLPKKTLAHVEANNKLNRHGMHLVKPGNVTCHECGAEFEGRSELFSHQKSVHSKGPHALRAKQEFEAARPRTRAPHAEAGIIYTVDNPHVPRFACKCGKNFALKGGLTRHIKENSMGIFVIFKCHLCPKSFMARYSLKSHLEAEHKIERDEVSHECRDCGKIFPTFKSLVKHRNKRHNQDK